MFGFWIDYKQNVIEKQPSLFPFYVGKNLVLPHCVFLLCVSPLLLTQNTSFLTLLVPKPVEVFPHNKQLCDTSRVFETLSQL